MCGGALHPSVIASVYFCQWGWLKTEDWPNHGYFKIVNHTPAPVEDIGDTTTIVPKPKAAHDP